MVTSRAKEMEVKRLGHLGSIGRWISVIKRRVHRIFSARQFTEKSIVYIGIIIIHHTSCKIIINSIVGYYHIIL